MNTATRDLPLEEQLTLLRWDGFMFDLAVSDRLCDGLTADQVRAEVEAAISRYTRRIAEIEAEIAAEEVEP